MLILNRLLMPFAFSEQRAEYNRRAGVLNFLLPRTVFVCSRTVFLLLLLLNHMEGFIILSRRKKSLWWQV